jgi:glycosyltransferase involved in cell wall biosynthesis
MSQPLVSVAICTFNEEIYLEKMLNSVLAQDYPNFEIVIVDDGSRDNTKAILERFAREHERIRPFYRTNHGLADSRSFSFSQAKGEWIAIIDQDDLCYPTRLSRQIEVAQKYPTAGLIFCNTHYINQHDEVIGDHLSKYTVPDSFVPAGDAGNLLLRSGCFVDSESCFIRRETVQRLGALDTSLFYACDYEYFIRAGLEVDFAYTTEILAAWRVHEKQAGQTYRKIRHEDRVVFRRYFWHKGVTWLTKAMLLKNQCKSYIGQILSGIRRTALGMHEGPEKRAS